VTAAEDQELLMQVLELREQIEECETEDQVEGMKRENEDRIARSVQILEDAFRRDDLVAARREAVRLRYWVNVEDTLREWEKGRGVMLQH
jgi:molecular chaperone HscB